MIARAAATLVLATGAVLAGEAPLEPHPLPGPLPRTWVLPDGRAAASEPSARRARVHGHDLVLVDVDGNGAFDDDGVDGWTLDGAGFLFPLGPRLVLGADVVQVSADRDTVRFDVERADLDDRSRALLEACNRARMHHGVPPLRADPDRTRGCRDHVAYMDRWGITQRPDPGRDGYTEAGARAASQGLLMRAVEPERNVATVFRAFPNRIWLFHPLLDRVGVACSEGHVALDVAAPLARRRPDWPVALPGPGTADNPTSLVEAGPRLFDGEARGLPITLHFPGAEVTDVEAELREGDAEGPLVETRVGTPAAPAHPSIPGNADCVCLVPREPLADGARYFVRVRYAFRGERGERAWTFGTAGAAAASEEDAPAVERDLPERARLRPIRVRQAPLLAFEPASPDAPREDPEARRATLGRDHVILFDLDGNGSFGDVDVDAWTLRKQRYAFPLEERLVIDEREYEIAVAGDEVRYRASTVPARKECREALVAWNEIRMRNGLPPVSLRHEHCAASERHALYMDRHGLVRREKPGAPGYTEEGAQAGGRSAVAPTPDLDEALRLFEQRFTNRHLVFAPHASLCGIGAGRGHAVFDPFAQPRRRRWRWPVIVPAPESEGCPTSFIASDPPLFPDVLTVGASGLAGLPITLHFPAREARFEKVEAEVREGGPRGKPIEILVATPDRPAHPRAERNYNAILLLPRAHLRKRTRYDVTVRFVRGGRPEEIRWWFRTGRS